MSVLGLGAMGAAVARALLAHGHTVTVWNRSPQRVAAFGTTPAALARSAAAAAGASTVVFVVLADGTAVRETLQTDGVSEALAGRTLVNLTSDLPEDATWLEAYAASAGARFLDGRIGGYPLAVGASGSNIIYAGPEQVAASVAPVLRALAPEVRHVGADVRSADWLATALYSVFHHAVLISYYEAAAMAARCGFPPETCLPLAQQTLCTAAQAIAHGTAQCARGDFDGDQASVMTHVAALERSRRVMAQVGAEHRIADVMVDYIERARDEGRGGEELAALFDVLSAGRAPAGTGDADTRRREGT